VYSLFACMRFILKLGNEAHFLGYREKVRELTLEVEELTLEKQRLSQQLAEYIHKEAEIKRILGEVPFGQRDLSCQRLTLYEWGYACMHNAADIMAQIP